MLTRGRGYRSQSLSLGLLSLVAVLLTGSAAAPPPGLAAPPPGLPAAGHGHDAHVDAPAPSETPADSVLRLQSLLGQHSVLAADLMRGRIRGDENFAQAADAALGKNTAGMSELVRSMFGDSAAQQFQTMWGRHVVALVDYARGLVDQDAALRSEARATLRRFERDLGSFFAGASQGRLTEQGAHHALLQHVEQLLRQADAYAADDFATANRIYRQAYRHTFDLGRTLAVALLPADQSVALREPTWRLRSELGKLLAEHVGLAVDATRAAIANSGDFAAAAEAVNGNTRDLAAAVNGLFGSAAADQFQALWADHVDNLMRYVSGTAAGDPDRREQARAGLDEFERRFAAFLTSATDRRLDTATLSRALLAHDDMLLRHADAFAAKDYQTAHDVAYTTFEHMFGLAGQLADAFGATVAARLPVGGAQTGHGGMAGVVGRR